MILIEILILIENLVFFPKALEAQAGPVPPQTRVYSTHSAPIHTYLAAAASWFLALGAPGSAERAFAASRSLLEAIEILFKLPTTWF